MNRFARLVAATLCSYLLGSVQSADIAARLAARANGSGPKDLRAHGTGNPGGLNAAKVLGTRWGVAVIAADIVKGAVASALGVGSPVMEARTQREPRPSSWRPNRHALCDGWSRPFADRGLRYHEPSERDRRPRQWPRARWPDMSRRAARRSRLQAEAGARHRPVRAG